jgi:tryptophan 2,3-dioxygenase
LHFAFPEGYMPTLPCGHEVSDAEQVHYCSYLRLAELLDLQPSPAALRHHDELLFIITLAPQDFFAFREALSPASGTESLQYREIEIRSGLRDTQKYRPALEVPPGSPGSESPQTRVMTERLAAAWEQPSLHDAFLALLSRRGVTPVGIYAPLDRSRHHDLFLLAEALLEYDELFGLWRIHHRMMVERSLSAATKGTGHTTGVRYLDRTLTYPHFFPELWQARATLWEERGEPGQAQPS